MSNKFFIPASTMITSILVWVVYLILHKFGGGLIDRSLWMGAGLCLAAGGLMIFSAISCRNVSGPRVGNYVRTVLLIIMAAITWWRVGFVDAGVLVIAAVVTGVLALLGPKAAEASVSASVKAGNKST